MKPRGGGEEPILNLPPVVSLVAGVLIAIHGARLLLPADSDDWLVGALGFVPLRYDGPIALYPGGWWSAVLSPLTHFLLHGDVVHLIINTTMMVAFGGFLARRLDPARFLGFVAICTIAGAVLFLLLNPGNPATMVGASGGISGLLAAGLRLMFSAIDVAPAGTAGTLIREATPQIPLQPLRIALARPQLRSAIAIWFVINMLAAFGLGTPSDIGAVAWEAHIGGFIAGLVLYGMFDPGPTDQD